MRYYTCEMPGCRHEDDLVRCFTCERVVCAAHSTPAGYNQRRCHDCAKPAHAAPEPQQMQLFPRVRPRAKPRALDGLVK